MRTSKGYREIRSENLILLKEKESNKKSNSTGCKNNLYLTRLLPLSALLFFVALSWLFMIKSRPGLFAYVEFKYNNSISVTAQVVESVDTTLSVDNTAKQVFEPEGEVAAIGAIDFIWQRGATSDKNKQQKGVVFLAHGCKHLPTDWFTKSSFCHNCTQSMPMEASIARYLVSRGYAVLAMKPQHNANKTQCWHPNDNVHLSSALTYLYQKIDTTHAATPLFAIGIANGGIFLGNNMESLQLTHRFKVSAIALMNCGIWHSNYKRDKYAAVLFVDTSRNSDVCQYNNETVFKLHAKGIPASQLVSEPIPLHPLYFFNGLASDKYVNIATTSTKIQFSTGISESESRALYEALMAGGYLWPATSVLLKDPTLDRNLVDIRAIATKVIPSYVPAKDSMDWSGSALVQLLKVAWGFKFEVSNEYLPQVVEWFEMNSNAAVDTGHIL